MSELSNIRAKHLYHKEHIACTKHKPMVTAQHYHSEQLFSLATCNKFTELSGTAVKKHGRRFHPLLSLISLNKPANGNTTNNLCQLNMRDWKEADNNCYTPSSWLYETIIFPHPSTLWKAVYLWANDSRPPHSSTCCCCI